MTRLVLSAALVILASAAVAQKKQYLSTNGAVFGFEQNQHGAILTSIEQIDNTGASSVGVPRMNVGDILYLGKSCDAFSEEFGKGSWMAISAGFVVDFAIGRIAFPGQAIEITASDQC
jgi:hypothetical protein